MAIFTERFHQIGVGNQNFWTTGQDISAIAGFHKLQLDGRDFQMAVAAAGDEMVVIVEGGIHEKVYGFALAKQVMYNRRLYANPLSDLQWRQTVEAVDAALSALGDEEDRIDFYAPFSEPVSVLRSADGQIMLLMQVQAYSDHLNGTTTANWITVKDSPATMDVAVAQHVLYRYFVTLAGKG